MIAPTWRQAIALAVASFVTLASVLEFPETAAQDRAPAVRAAARHSQAEEKAPAIPKGSIRIENRDSSALLSLSLASGGDTPDVVARNVPSGASVVVALPKPDECVYNVEAKFEDWSWVTVPSFDLCQDQTLNIGEGSTSTARASAPVKAAAPLPSANAKKIATRSPSDGQSQPGVSHGPIRIENRRHSTLLTLLLTVRGESPHLVAQIVASGASVTVAFPEAGKCVYDVKGEFADNYGTSLPGLDLCKEPTLKFVE